MKKNKTLGFILATVMVFGSVATVNTGVANAASENTKSIVQESSIKSTPKEYTVYQTEAGKLDELYIKIKKICVDNDTYNDLYGKYDVKFINEDGQVLYNAEILRQSYRTLGTVVFEAKDGVGITHKVYVKSDTAKGNKWLFQRSEAIEKNIYAKLEAAENAEGWKVIKSTLRIEGNLVERSEIYKLDKNGPGSELYYTIDIMHDAIKEQWEKGNDGYWYYYDKDGNAVRGFHKITWEGVQSTYYFDQEGRMQTGWKQIDGQWYYFNAGGSMKTGWLKSGDKWYYLQDNGIMVTGWNKINYNKPGFSPNIKQSYWFYFGENGDMTYGWKKIDNKWYYFDGYGAMAENILVDGKYFVDHNGVWDGITIE